MIGGSWLFPEFGAGFAWKKDTTLRSPKAGGNNKLKVRRNKEATLHTHGTQVELSDCDCCQKFIVVIYIRKVNLGPAWPFEDDQQVSASFSQALRDFVHSWRSVPGDWISSKLGDENCVQMLTVEVVTCCLRS